MHFILAWMEYQCSRSREIKFTIIVHLYMHVQLQSPCFNTKFIIISVICPSQLCFYLSLVLFQSFNATVFCFLFNLIMVQFSLQLWLRQVNWLQILVQLLLTPATSMAPFIERKLKMIKILGVHLVGRSL